MAEVITLLALTPTMEEGTLAEWLKPEGEPVEEGEIIAEVETDKATMEMESFFEGTMLKVLVKPGDTVAVGAPLAVVGQEGEDIGSLLADLQSGGGNVSEDQVAAGSVEERESREERNDKQTAREKATRPPSEPSSTRDVSGDEHRPPLTQRAEGQGQEQEESGTRIRVSPLARRIAEERGLDLRQLAGSGPSGRIIKRDVESAQRPQQQQQPSAKAPSSGAVAQAPEGGVRAPLSQMRKTIARRLTEVWQATPHFFLTRSIDMAPAMKQRKHINEQLAAAGIETKISVNDLIIKACAVALRRYPAMNVSFQGDHLVEHADVHIGVAVAIEDGLITPKIAHADRKSLTAVASEVRELMGRARDKKLRPEEYTGSTFTLSNLGMFGIEEFTAIINPPEAGILACGAVEKIPVVQDDALTVGTRMKVTLSCDHRAVDGATGAQFLQELARILESPVLLMV